jgi:hypothetical protein
MRSKCFFLGFVPPAMSLLGCGATQEQLVRRAAFDLNCSESQISVVELDDRSRGVSGCGKKAVYLESCTTQNRERSSCTWVLNTPAGQ